MKKLIKEKDRKKAMLIFGIPLIVLFIGSIIIYSQKNQEGQETQIENRDGSGNVAEIPEIGAEEWKDGVKKQDVYSDFEREAEEQERRKSETISDVDFFDVGNKEINNKEKEEEEEKGIEQKKTHSSYRGSTWGGDIEKKEIKKEKSQNEITETKKKNIVINVPKEEEVAEKKEIRKKGGLGIYEVKNEVKQVKTEKEFIPAFLEKDQKVQDNSSIVFLLEKDMVINGISFRRHSILYARTQNSGDRIMIQVTRIKNYADGQTHNITMIGYDENYTQGIAVNTNKSIQQTTGDVISEAANVVGYSNGVGRIVSSGARREGQQRGNKSEVSLSQGYRMFFMTN